MKTLKNNAVLHDNGDITGLPKIKPATHPNNQKCEDSLMQTEILKNHDRELLLEIIDKRIEEYTD